MELKGRGRMKGGRGEGRERGMERDSSTYTSVNETFTSSTGQCRYQRRDWHREFV